MDKVNGSHSQSIPAWERQKAGRGHYSSVDGAIRAHRQRKLDRQNRVAERLNMVRGMQNQFFPQSNVMSRPDLISEPIQSQGFQNQARIENQIPVSNPGFQDQIPQAPQFNPVEMDEIYAEASMGSVADNALGVVQKEIANPNPEEGPIDDMPKGSYVDYTV